MMAERVKNGFLFAAEKAIMIFAILFGILFMWIMAELMGWQGIAYLVGFFLVLTVLKVGFWRFFR